ncbi:IS3 family transposase [Streptomyces sp. NPDC001750]|uniref:IS3 family transposase n=1 Tax=Streptomyces sp. NPDC001750 TaxID=3364607 RepID=UPI0036A2C29E
MNRCQFVEDHQRRYGVKRLCRILGIARSSFYHWRRSAPLRAARQAADAQLAARIRVIHQASDGTYGVPGITAELREDGERVNHKRVARIMQATGLAGLRLRRKHRTTIPDPAAAKVPDLLIRDSANAPGVSWGSAVWGRGRAWRPWWTTTPSRLMVSRSGPASIHGVSTGSAPYSSGGPAYHPPEAPSGETSTRRSPMPFPPPSTTSYSSVEPGAVPLASSVIRSWSPGRDGYRPSPHHCLLGR